jgi:hypothetical protein
MTSVTPGRGVLVGVLVAVGSGVFVGVLVAVGSGVSVGVFVGVFVGVLVGVLVGVDVGVLVGGITVHLVLSQTVPGVRHSVSTHLFSLQEFPDGHSESLAHVLPHSGFKVGEGVTVSVGSGVEVGGITEHLVSSHTVPSCKH